MGSAPITLDLMPGFPANIGSQAIGNNAGGVIAGHIQIATNISSVFSLYH